MHKPIMMTLRDAGASAGHGPPGLDTLLCADVGCTQRCAPTVGQLAQAIEGDNPLSAAIEAKITAAMREYTGERFAAQAERTDSIEGKIDINSAAIRRLEESTTGIVELMTSFAGAMKTIELIGKTLRPITWIIGFVAALLGLWATVRGVRGE
jgi:hypothetical protein